MNNASADFVECQAMPKDVCPLAGVVAFLVVLVTVLSGPSLASASRNNTPVQTERNHPTSAQPSSTQPPIPRSAHLGPRLHSPVLTVGQAISYALRAGALLSWFRKPYQATYGSWLDWVPRPAKSSRVDVWRIVVRNVAIPYRDCGHVFPRPGRRQPCTTYHNVAILVIDPSSKGAIFDYF